MSKNKKEIDENAVKYMVGHFFTKEEVCAALSISAEKLDRWLKKKHNTTWMDFKRQNMVFQKMSIQKMAFQKAKSGYYPAIKDLCEVYVWPEHKHKIQISGDSSAPIVTEQKNNYDNLSVQELEMLYHLSDKLKSNA